MRQAIETKKRKAFATILVLVAILAISLMVYAFANQTYLEHAATRASMRQTQARLTALSGVEWTRHQLSLANRTERETAICPTESIGGNKAIAQTRFEQYGAMIYQSISRSGQTGKHIGRMGLASESAKLNIHSLDLTKKGESISRARLCSLPNMTLQMADALLDWIDEDDEPRTYGAESAWYTQNASENRPANGRIEAWSDMLFIRGFTEQLLFGEDTNKNGWLDWNENDGDKRMPMDNQDGILETGLAAYLSLDAFEWNRDRFGKPKIYLNDENLDRLFSNLAKRYGEELANFIVAYRTEGPIRKETKYNSDAVRKDIRNSLEERLDFQLTPSEKSKTTSQPFLSRGGAQKGVVARNRAARHPIHSVLDLIDCSVLTIIDSEERILTSPWKLGGANTHDLIFALEAELTTVDGDQLLGRIDITQASPEVLLTIPGFTRSMSNSLIQMRGVTETNASIPSVYWLVETQVMDMDFLRTIGRYLTTQGAIYSGYSVGHDSISQSASIIQFALSCEGTSVRLLKHCEVGMTPWMRQDFGNERSKQP